MLSYVNFQYLNFIELQFSIRYIIELAQGNALCDKRWLGSVDWSINELLKNYLVSLNITV